LDWVLLVLLLAFTIRGVLRGTVAQVFAFCGLLIGVWVAGWVAGWVGAHWHDARPAFLFLLLRWLVAALAALAVVTLVGWWGEALAKAIHEGPFGWLDRLGGGVVGLGFGAALAAVVALVALLAPGLGFARAAVQHGVCGRPLVSGGALVTAWRGVPFPGAAWLHHQFVVAEHRFSISRSS